MRVAISPRILLITILLCICACKDDKPTAPQNPAFAVSLEYQNPLGNIYCLRLMVGTNPINQCGLGVRSSSIWAGDYECKLYAVNGYGPDETLTLLATSPLHLDRNFTCVVDGVNVYWWYWG
jgi:hypothetical protein